jgi:hypothetical protein
MSNLMAPAKKTPSFQEGTTTEVLPENNVLSVVEVSDDATKKKTKK